VSRAALPSMAQLLAFDAAARLGSFKEAAAALHRTPSTISHDVAALETFLGALLFERRTRAVLLTDAGRAYADAVAGLLDGLAGATAQLRSRCWPDAVRISTNPLMAAEIVTPLIPRFEAEFPGVQLHLSVTETLEDPGQGAVDLAIRYGGTDQRNLEQVQICDSTALPVAAPGVDWDGAPRIDYVLGTSTAWTQWQQLGHALPGGSGRVHRFSQFAAAVGAAERGLGITLAPRPLLNPLIRSGRLVAMPNAETMSVSPITLISRRLGVDAAVWRGLRDWWRDALRSALHG